MDELRERIRNANLTKTQKMIAKYVLDNSADACFMTSTEIAQKLGVSESSVIRFSRSIGFSGFIDFQKALRRDYQDQVLSISNSITVPSQRIAQREKFGSDPGYLDRHYKNALKNLEAVFTNNSLDDFEKAADIIVGSRHKYIIASRGNSSLGDYFSLYLKHMVPNVENTNSSEITPIDHMCNISREDCAVIFSFPRYSTEDRLCAEMAAEAGAKIVVITDKPTALLAPFADLLLTVPIDNNTFFNCNVAPQFVAEALLDTISHRVTGIEKRLKKIDKYLEKSGNY